MNLDEIPSDLAVQLAVLEMRRKYPDLSGKGAALIWNDQVSGFTHFCLADI